MNYLQLFITISVKVVVIYVNLCLQFVSYRIQYKLIQYNGFVCYSCVMTPIHNISAHIDVLLICHSTLTLLLWRFCPETFSQALSPRHLHPGISTPTSPPQHLHPGISTPASPPQHLHPSISTPASPPRHLHLGTHTLAFLSVHFHQYISISTFPSVHFHQYISISTFSSVHFPQDISIGKFLSQSCQTTL